MPAWLALVDPISRLIDKLIPDKEAAAKAKLDLMKEENAQALQELQIAAQGDANQAEINKVEAANTNLFVSGARPFIMWTCGIAFAYHYVVQPFLAFAISNYYGKMVLLPAIDMQVIGYTLTGILGIGGSFRTFEKVKGVAR